MKKTVLVVCIITITLGLATVLINNSDKNHKKTVSSLRSELQLEKDDLIELRKINEELETKNNGLEETLRTMNQNEEIQNKLKWYEETAKSLTEIKHIEYQIMDQSISRNGVVYIENAPNNYREVGMYLLRLAMEFDLKDYNKVTFWNDRSSAKLFAEDKLKLDTPSSYNGRILGVLERTENGTVLRQYYNQEDSIVIEFGSFIRE